jgi:TRAP-type uncharacterized transport system substrate-binding protein
MRTGSKTLVYNSFSQLSLIITCVIALITISAIGAGYMMPAHGQAVPKNIEEGGPEAALRAKKNQWTIGVAGGILSGTNMTFADELAQVLDDGDNLRIIPMVTYGAAQNLDDLLYLRGVDVAMTQSDVFEYFRTQRKTPNLDQRVHYIMRLPVSEMHVLARRDIRSLEDLRGKKVNFGPAGSASSLTGSIIFQRLGLQVEQTLFDNAVAMQKVRSGEVAALIRVIGRPIDYFAKIPADAGLHLVPIPFTIGEFSHAEYPTLVPEGRTTDTIAVPAVLAAFNWQKNTDRYRRVQKFVDVLFAQFDKFRQPPRHPKWKDVNLAATVPGWTRLSLADEALRRLRPDAPDAQIASSEFTAFLRASGTVGANLSQEQREVLFREFLRWRETQRTTVRPR